MTSPTAPTTELATVAPSADPARRCRSCGQADVELFHQVDGVPVHDALVLDDAEAARSFPTGDLHLGWCGACGFIQNVAFDPARLRYGAGYEDSQAHSPRFVAFATEVATSLLDRYPTHGGQILEIGCGKGDFLALICELHGDRGVGYDPVLSAYGARPARDGIRWVAERFDASTSEDDVALVVCRHTLEHVADVDGFAADLLGYLDRQQAVAYLEVPDTMRILRDGAFWDLYFEHCSYFTCATLEDLLVRHGAAVLDSRLGYAGQYVQLELRAAGASRPPARTTGDHVEDVRRAVAHFRREVDRRQEHWSTHLDRWAAENRRVALWGGGSKAVGFLAAVDRATEVVGPVVDINPAKHGRFLPGSGHCITAPHDLRQDPPDVVILMNPIYRDEVTADLAALDLFPEVLAL